MQERTETTRATRPRRGYGRRSRAGMAYLRRWLPFWTHCLLTGAALGLTVGVGFLAVTAWYVAPVWVVILGAALRHLHATRGTRILTTTAREALGGGPRPVDVERGACIDL